MTFTEKRRDKMKKQKDAVASEHVYKGIKISALQNKDDLYMALSALVPNNINIHNSIILCIGTDRSSGDSLAPFVGTYLTSMGYKNVYGTLDNPVHAMNLKETIESLPKDKTVIAIDACLGQQSTVGTMQMIKGALKPGAGVNKKLPEIGDYSIIGVVNVGGFMEYFVLQNTRLSLVVKMAKEITSALVQRFPLECENKTTNKRKRNYSDEKIVEKLKKMGLKADLVRERSKIDIFMEEMKNSEKAMEEVIESVKNR
jgi:putative sporulation protein YyaC